MLSTNCELCQAVLTPFVRRFFLFLLLLRLGAGAEYGRAAKGLSLFAHPFAQAAGEVNAVPSSSSQGLSLIVAAHLLDVRAGRLLSPGQVLVRGNEILEAGTSVSHPARATLIDLGSRTLMPGLIDAHVHLFLHPGAEDLQTVEESVPQRVIIATLAARADLMAGFTSERDMGTEGAGSADTAVRNAIDRGLIPGPRLRISGNAIDILGGHEDANRFNPEQRVLPNATRANGVDQLITVIREQFKEGADFIKIYETGRDRIVDGQFTTSYQFTTEELRAAVKEAARVGKKVAVHATGEPGAGFAAAAGVASIDHAYQLAPETMRLMKDRQIYAVPTFAIGEYFAEHAQSPERAKTLRDEMAYHATEFRKQLAAGVSMAVGSDVGPFPHGTQAREFELMEKFGMQRAEILRADLLNGAKLLGWDDRIGELKPHYYADIIAVEGDPLSDLTALRRVSFVMKQGIVFRSPAVSNAHTPSI